MRLWSLHPRYLDQVGLVALWREGLLAKKVLEGNTRGYRHHPQLDRFRTHFSPAAAINNYLAAVLSEAMSRGYHFNQKKIDAHPPTNLIPVTTGQLIYERKHLSSKLSWRSPKHLVDLPEFPDPHPLLIVVEGGIENWERVVQ